MEKINERKMSTFVLSSFINFGIGFVFGFIVSLIFTIATRGFGALSFLITPLIVGLIFATISTNLYRVYFYYRLSLDVNAVCEGDGLESESYLFAAVIGSLTFGLYDVYWMYKLAQRLRVNAPRYGFKMMETGKDIVVLGAFSFGLISAWELMKNMNRVADVYNREGLAEVVGGVQ